jgi:peptidoglycan/LPS O-acetylase OafA/YrhL
MSPLRVERCATFRHFRNDFIRHDVGLASYGLNFTLLALGVAMMLVPLGKGIGNRAMSFGTGWLRALGRWSYEIYLFRMLPLLGLIARRV